MVSIFLTARKGTTFFSHLQLISDIFCKKMKKSGNGHPFPPFFDQNKYYLFRNCTTWANLCASSTLGAQIRIN